MKKAVIVSFIIILITVVIASLIFINDKSLVNKITGQAELNTYTVVLMSEDAYCRTNFTQGWNLVSFPCVPPEMNMSTALESINGNILSLHEYTGISSDKWAAYNPSLPSWVIQDLTQIDRNKGYWINMKEYTNFDLNGSITFPNIYLMSRGWHLIGYPTLTKKDIEEALVSLNGSYDFIYLYNSTTENFQEYTQNQSKISLQDITKIVPYYGYWIYMIKDDTLYIDW